MILFLRRVGRSTSITRAVESGFPSQCWLPAEQQSWGSETSRTSRIAVCLSRFALVRGQILGPTRLYLRAARAGLAWCLL